MVQKTLQKSATVSAIALHTGRRVTLTLHPAPADSGVVFRRVDLPGAPEVPALVDHVVDVRRGTTIARGEAVVHTVEHLLAALYASGVNNAVVEMTGPEPPVCDGSSEPFLDLIEQAGIRELDRPAQTIRVQEPVYLEEGGVIMVVLPDERYRISCTVKYGNAVVEYCQFQSMEVTHEAFRRDICRARTFCLYEEIEALMQADLIAGGSLDNAVVIKDDAVLSRDGLRYPDEFVRHKMLDIVGDLSLTGARLCAHVVAVRPGHPTNVALARMIRARFPAETTAEVASAGSVHA